MRIVRQGLGFYIYFKNSVWMVGWFKPLPKKADPSFDSLIDQYKYSAVISAEKDKKLLRKKNRKTTKESQGKVLVRN